jgi:hypothetical protein
VFNRCINDKIQSTEWDKGFRFENKGLTPAQIAARDRQQAESWAESQKPTKGDLIVQEMMRKSDEWKSQRKGIKGFFNGMKLGSDKMAKLIIPFLPPQFAAPMTAVNSTIGGISDSVTNNPEDVTAGGSINSVRRRKRKHIKHSKRY